MTLDDIQQKYPQATRIPPLHCPACEGTGEIEKSGKTKACLCLYLEPTFNLLRRKIRRESDLWKILFTVQTILQDTLEVEYSEVAIKVLEHIYLMKEQQKIVKMKTKEEYEKFLETS